MSTFFVSVVAIVTSGTLSMTSLKDKKFHFQETVGVVVLFYEKIGFLLLFSM